MEVCCLESSLAALSSTVMQILEIVRQLVLLVGRRAFKAPVANLFFLYIVSFSCEVEDLRFSFLPPPLIFSDSVHFIQSPITNNAVWT